MAMAAPTGVPSRIRRRSNCRCTAASRAVPSVTPSSSTTQMLHLRAGSALELGAVPDAHGRPEVALGVGVHGSEDAVELALVERPDRHLADQVDGVLEADGEPHGEQIEVAAQ